MRGPTSLVLFAGPFLLLLFLVLSLAPAQASPRSLCLVSSVLVLPALLLSHKALPAEAQRNRAENRRNRRAGEPTETDVRLAEMQAMNEVMAEKEAETVDRLEKEGEDGDDEKFRDMEGSEEDELLRRVEALAAQKLEGKYPGGGKTYNTKNDIKRLSQSDDMFENGTFVQYLAYAMAAMMACLGVFAFKDELFAGSSSSSRRTKRAKRKIKIDKNN